MKKMILLAAVVAMVAMMAGTASADTIGTGVVSGTAKVGETPGNVAKDACTDPSGQGLTLPSQTNHTGGWHLVTNAVTAAGTFHGVPDAVTSGSLDACGYLGPNDLGIGASCGSSGGHGGVGKLRLNGVNGVYWYNLSDLGWNSFGSLLVVTGDYQEQTTGTGGSKGTKTTKVGSITAVFNARGGAACASPGGATDFDVNGVVAFTQP